MILIDVVIVSWNTRALLKECLTALFNSLADISPEELRVWVADNASTDGSLEMVAREFPEVITIANVQNLGFAGGNNQAIRMGTAPYVLLLNPDTEIQAGGLDTLYNYLETHPKAGVAGSRLLNPDGSLQPAAFPFPTIRRELWRLLYLDKIAKYGVYPLNDWATDEVHKVGYVQGASMLVRRTCLDQVGLFDENYFMYSEEVDLCYRITLAGWDIYWVPQSQVIHYGGQSTRQVAQKMFLCLYQSKLLFFRKNYGRGSALLYKIVLFLASLFRMLLKPLAYFESGERKLRHIQLAENYRLLLNQLPDW